MVLLVSTVEIETFYLSKYTYLKVFMVFYGAEGRKILKANHTAIMTYKRKLLQLNFSVHLRLQNLNKSRKMRQCLEDIILKVILTHTLQIQHVPVADRSACNDV